MALSNVLSFWEYLADGAQCALRDRSLELASAFPEPPALSLALICTQHLRMPLALCCAVDLLPSIPLLLISRSVHHCVRLSSQPSVFRRSPMRLTSYLL